MRWNVYGWFERTDRGVYALTQAGREALARWPQPNARSEERRVGKECRSLCDWSSDVCSSDLHALECLRLVRADRPWRLRSDTGRSRSVGALAAAEREIGRASCRERV